jgi:hypothetical protein
MIDQYYTVKFSNTEISDTTIKFRDEDYKTTELSDYVQALAFEMQRKISDKFSELKEYDINISFSKNKLLFVE